MIKFTLFTTQVQSILSCVFCSPYACKWRNVTYMYDMGKSMAHWQVDKVR
jgi:hypothetical protein